MRDMISKQMLSIWIENEKSEWRSVEGFATKLQFAIDDGRFDIPSSEEIEDHEEMKRQFTALEYALYEFISKCFCKNGTAILPPSFPTDTAVSCPRCTWAREALTGTIRKARTT